LTTTKFGGLALQTFQLLKLLITVNRVLLISTEHLSTISWTKTITLK